MHETDTQELTRNQLELRAAPTWVVTTDPATGDGLLPLARSTVERIVAVALPLVIIGLTAFGVWMIAYLATTTM